MMVSREERLSLSAEGCWSSLGKALRPFPSLDELLGTPPKHVRYGVVVCGVLLGNRRFLVWSRRVSKHHLISHENALRSSCACFFRSFILNR